MRFDALLDVTREIIVYNSVRSSRFKVGDHFRDRAPCRPRWSYDRDGSVILFNDDLDALLHFFQHRVQIASDLCLRHVDCHAAFDHSLFLWLPADVLREPALVRGRLSYNRLICR